MENQTYKIDSKNLTKNNIEKIKKSIDCLKETIKRSNSHLYLNRDSLNRTLYNNKENNKVNLNLFLNSYRYDDNPYKISTNTNLNNAKTIASPKKLNNISFYNINITNNNDKKGGESTRSLYSCNSTLRNKYDKRTNSCIIRNNSTKQKSIFNVRKNDTSNINQEKIKNSINKIENINEEINSKYNNIIQEYKISYNENITIKKKNLEILKKIQMIKNINAKLKKRIEKIKLKEINIDYNKEKNDLLEKNKEFNLQIEQKDKMIEDIKNQINDLINGHDKINCLNEINNKNNEIEELKNKINQFYKDISIQDELINKIKVE